MLLHYWGHGSLHQTEQTGNHVHVPQSDDVEDNQNSGDEGEQSQRRLQSDHQSAPVEPIGDHSPYGPSSSIGIVCNANTMPIAVAEPVNSRTNQD